MNNNTNKLFFNMKGDLNEKNKKQSSNIINYIFGF